MATTFEKPLDVEQSPTRTSYLIPKLGLIGGILAALAVGFAYLGGWFSHDQATPAGMTDTFEQLDGVHPGFRRNHAKGVCVSGVFESNGNGVRLSKAVVFREGSVPVSGRFSLGGGDPYAADTAHSVRGLGLQFVAPNGEVWRTAMINLPVFPVRTPEAFQERLQALIPDGQTGKVDPDKMTAFLKHHPETVKALAVIKEQPVSSGFDNSTYYALNTFEFTNATGETHAARWFLVPEQPFQPAGPSRPGEDKNYLFQTLIGQVHQQPLRWRLIVMVAEPGDPTDDATIAWPQDRVQVDVGTLILDQIESDDTSPVRDITFDPMVLPPGIAPSNDPLLSARSAVYSQSYRRRAGEPKTPSPITPDDTRKGN